MLSCIDCTRTVHSLAIHHLRPFTNMRVRGRCVAKSPPGAIDVPIAAFECRGCEPVNWTPTGGYTCRGAGGAAKEFEVDFEDNEWADYDDANDSSV